MARELKLTPASKVETRLWHGDWGPWRLDPETRVLYPVWPYRYEVDLDACTTSAEVLDWIIQVAQKGWASAEHGGNGPEHNPDGWTDDAILAGLVRALDDVLHPQANLCSFGASKRLSRRRIVALVDLAADHERAPGRGMP
jgi:hypothetical protein